ncbi:hypothetical protein OC834_007075, partial [Tilletia horrida]
HQPPLNVNQGASSQHVRAAPYLSARTMTHATTAAGPSTLIKAPPAVRRGGTLGATAMLVGYASSDDSEDGDDDDDDDDGPPEEVSSKPLAASDAPDAPTLAEGAPPETAPTGKGAEDAETEEHMRMEEDAEVGGEDVKEDGGEGEEGNGAQPSGGGGGGGGLAALVQQLGWASRPNVALSFLKAIILASRRIALRLRHC